ncbi:MAG: hypothetical protein WB760_29060 [Xanthobacteraceae bacterium]
MPRQVDHAIHDILEAIARVQQITSGKSFREFEESWQLCWLVQHAIEAIAAETKE